MRAELSDDFLIKYAMRRFFTLRVGAESGLAEIDYVEYTAERSVLARAAFRKCREVAFWRGMCCTRAMRWRKGSMKI